MYVTIIMKIEDMNLKTNKVRFMEMFEGRKREGGNAVTII